MGSQRYEPEVGVGGAGGGGGGGAVQPMAVVRNLDGTTPDLATGTQTQVITDQNGRQQVRLSGTWQHYDSPLATPAITHTISPTPARLAEIIVSNPNASPVFIILYNDVAMAGPPRDRFYLEAGGTSSRGWHAIGGKQFSTTIIARASLAMDANTDPPLGVYVHAEYGV